MKLLWVKGNLPLSHLIMWGLSEPVSHFAIALDDKIVFHSDMLGLHIAWKKSFDKTHTTVFEHEIDLPLIEEEAIYRTILDQYDGASYDFGAFAYFAWRAFLKKCFKKEMPQKNPWGSKNHFLCDEIIQLLPIELIGQELKEADLAMKSPYQTWLMFQNHLKLVQEQADLSKKE